MSEFKGNTGKWSYSQRLGEVKSSDSGILCFVLATGKEDFNGMLMAAAPELLEACLRIQSHFRQAGIESKASSLNPVEDSAAQIDAVILKALGQQQL